MSTMTTSRGTETSHEELVPGFCAQTALERAVASDPDVRRGWAFCVQETGHPEHLVGAHVAGRPAEALDNDHAVLARRVAERHTSDRRLLQTIEPHDEAYWIFKNKRTEPDALDGLLARARFHDRGQGPDLPGLAA